MWYKLVIINAQELQFSSWPQDKPSKGQCSLSTQSASSSPYRRQQQCQLELMSSTLRCWRSPLVLSCRMVVKFWRWWLLQPIEQSNPARQRDVGGLGAVPTPPLLAVRRSMALILSWEPSTFSTFTYEGSARAMGTACPRCYFKISSQGSCSSQTWFSWSYRPVIW